MATPDNAPAKQATPRPARLTGRGAVIGMAVVFTVGLLVASWLGLTVLAGVLFVLGSALATWYTRPTDLLLVVLTPAPVFAGALIFVEVLTAQGSLLLSVVAGTVVTLASVALWLTAGTLLAILIAWRRGLPQCVRDLRRDLRAAQSERARLARRAPVTAGRAVPAAARAGARTASAPEPPRRPQHR